MSAFFIIAVSGLAIWGIIEYTEHQRRSKALPRPAQIANLNARIDQLERFVAMCEDATWHTKEARMAMDSANHLRLQANELQDIDAKLRINALRLRIPAKLLEVV